MPDLDDVVAGQKEVLDEQKAIIILVERCAGGLRRAQADIRDIKAKQAKTDMEVEGRFVALTTKVDDLAVQTMTEKLFSAFSTIPATAASKIPGAAWGVALVLTVGGFVSYFVPELIGWVTSIRAAP